jgi:hypothetical protein
VVVSDYSSGYASAGNYKLYFERAPGSNEGGALSPGGVVSGTIDLGDLDSYTFSANAGQGILLRTADVDNGSFVPTLAVYDPAGARIDFQYGASVAASAFSAPSTGTYTVVVSDYSSGYASAGNYKLYFDRAPGSNEGGAMSSGVAVSGTIDLGDLDSYTFGANAGASIQLRATDVDNGTFVPAMAVFGPSGSRVDLQYGASAAVSAFKAPSSGTYTVVVYDYSSGYASTGNYDLTLTSTGP